MTSSCISFGIRNFTWVHVILVGLCRECGVVWVAWVTAPGSVLYHVTACLCGQVAPWPWPHNSTCGACHQRLCSCYGLCVSLRQRTTSTFSCGPETLLYFFEKQMEDFLKFTYFRVLHSFITTFYAIWRFLTVFTKARSLDEMWHAIFSKTITIAS
jgi:hypothetical protein